MNPLLALLALYRNAARYAHSFFNATQRITREQPPKQEKSPNESGRI